MSFSLLLVWTSDPQILDHISPHVLLTTNQNMNEPTPNWSNDLQGGERQVHMFIYILLHSNITAV